MVLTGVTTGWITLRQKEKNTSQSIVLKILLEQPIQLLAIQVYSMSRYIFVFNKLLIVQTKSIKFDCVLIQIYMK